MALLPGWVVLNKHDTVISLQSLEADGVLSHKGEGDDDLRPPKAAIFYAPMDQHAGRENMHLYGTMAINAAGHWKSAVVIA